MFNPQQILAKSKIILTTVDSDEKNLQIKTVLFVT